jgi:hypothetical protein
MSPKTRIHDFFIFIGELPQCISASFSGIYYTRVTPQPGNFFLHERKQGPPTTEQTAEKRGSNLYQELPVNAAGWK